MSQKIIIWANVLISRFSEFFQEIESECKNTSTRAAYVIFKTYILI